MSCLEIENDEIGEVGSVFVLTTKDEELVALVKGSGMACSKVSTDISNIAEITYPFSHQEYHHSCPLSKRSQLVPTNSVQNSGWGSDGGVRGAERSWTEWD